MFFLLSNIISPSVELYKAKMNKLLIFNKMMFWQYHKL